MDHPLLVDGQTPVEPWLVEAVRAYDEMQGAASVSRARAVIDGLEAYVGGAAEGDAGYLVARGLARYLVDRDDEGLADYERALALGVGEPVRSEALLRAAQLHAHHRRWEACGAALDSVPVACALRRQALLRHRVDLDLRLARGERGEGLLRAGAAVLSLASELGRDDLEAGLVGRLVEHLTDTVRHATERVRAELALVDAIGVDGVAWALDRLTDEDLLRVLSRETVDELVRVAARRRAPAEERLLAVALLVRSGLAELAAPLAPAPDRASHASTYEHDVLCCLMQRAHGDPEGARTLLEEHLAPWLAVVSDPSMLVDLVGNMMRVGALRDLDAVFRHPLRERLEPDGAALLSINVASAAIDSGEPRRAIDILGRVDPSALSAERTWLALYHHNYAVALTLTGAVAAASVHCRVVEGLLGDIVDVHLRAVALAGLLEHAAITLEAPWGSVIAWANAAEELLDEVSPREADSLRVAIGFFFRQIGMSEEAQRWLLPVAESSATPQLRTQALGWLSDTVASPAESLRLARRAVRHARGHPTASSTAWYFLGLRQIEHDSAAAGRAFRRAARVGLAGGRLLLVAESWAMLGRLEGHHPRSLGWFRRAVRLGQTLADHAQDDVVLEQSRARFRPYEVEYVQAAWRFARPEQQLEAIVEVKAGDFLGSLRSQVHMGDALSAAFASALAESACRTPQGDAVAAPGLSILRDAPAVPVDPLALRAEHRALARRHREIDMGARDVQRALLPGQVAVEYYLTDPDDGWLLASVVSRTQIRTVRRRWSRRHAEALRTSRRLVTLAAGDGDVALLRDRLGRLYDVLIRPLEAYLRETTDLVLAPGGLLSDVPFPALLDASGCPLLQRFRLSFVVSAAQLALTPAPPTRPRTALVLRGDDDGLAPLPCADEEVRHVRAAADRAGVELLDASQSDMLARAELIHYAGHAGVRRGGGGVADLHLSGPVSSREIATLNLGAHPVVMLSACETAATSRDHDAVTGMLHAFFAAGASGIVASTWLADDLITAATSMAWTERVLAGQHPAHALSEVTRALAAVPQAHPFFWANFRWYGRPPGGASTPARSGKPRRRG